jgi:hypothetical protein
MKGIRLLLSLNTWTKKNFFVLFFLIRWPKCPNWKSSVLFNRYRWVGFFPLWYLLRFINNAVAYSTVYSDSSTSGRLLSVCSRRMPAIQAMRSFQNGGGNSQAQQVNIEGKQCCVVRNNRWCHQTNMCWRGSANVFFGGFKNFFVFVFWVFGVKRPSHTSLLPSSIMVVCASRRRLNFCNAPNAFCRAKESFSSNRNTPTNIWMRLVCWEKIEQTSEYCTSAIKEKKTTNCSDEYIAQSDPSLVFGWCGYQHFMYPHSVPPLHVSPFSTNTSCIPIQYQHFMYPHSVPTLHVSPQSLNQPRTHSRSSD